MVVMVVAVVVVRYKVADLGDGMMKLAILQGAVCGAVLVWFLSSILFLYAFCFMSSCAAFVPFVRMCVCAVCAVGNCPSCAGVCASGSASRSRCAASPSQQAWAAVGYVCRLQRTKVPGHGRSLNR